MPVLQEQKPVGPFALAARLWLPASLYLLRPCSRVAAAADAAAANSGKGLGVGEGME